MKWYPWLNQPYKEIIHLHQKKQGHHALLLHANTGMGTESLVYAISRWLMCQNPLDIKSCGNCHSCQLMLANTHPDWHKVSVNENQNMMIGIESIHYLTEVLFNHAQQGGAKVIWFPNVDALSESASNALLKTLEEPTKNTYFLLECRNLSTLLTTLRSRCFYYYLFAPKPETVIFWLQKQKISSVLVDIETAVKLNTSAPLAALTMLHPKNWLKRKKFCQTLSQHLTTKTIFNWLSELDQPDIIERINWLITLLIDAIKYKQQATDYCINKDQLLLIAKLANINSVNVLLKSAIEWQNCRYQLISIIGLNKKLRLASQLVNWHHKLYCCQS